MKTRVHAAVSSALLFVLASAIGQTRSVYAQKIKSVEMGLGPSAEIIGTTTTYVSLASEMQKRHVPGVSIAFIHHGRIQWAKGYGVLREGGPAVTSDTLFQAASISKSLTAMGALRLVEEGKLSLDASVNSELKSWQVPQNAFTAEHPVTLRELLGHTAGVNVHGFAGYAAGTPVPTLLQILGGEKPANSDAIRIVDIPGKAYSYAGGGYVIVQQMMTDATAEAFPLLMQRLVLGPVGMSDSSFQQPLNPALVKTAALPVDDKGKPVIGGPHTYPEMAAAGLWTTPTDLAKWVIAVQRSLRGEGPVLTASTMRLMVTNVSHQYGLGIGVLNNAGRPSFLHTGGNEGYRDVYFAYESGDGAVIMTSGDNGDAIFKELLRSMAKAYGWPDFRPLRVSPRLTTGEDFDRFQGRFTATDIGPFEVRRKGNALEFGVGDHWNPLGATSGSVFFGTDTPFTEEVSFDTPDSGKLLLDGSWFAFHRLRSSD